MMDGLVNKQQDEQPDPAFSRPPNTNAAPSESDAAFDQWLAHHLGRLYEPVASEPVPPELVRLLESCLR